MYIFVHLYMYIFVHLYKKCTFLYICTFIFLMYRSGAPCFSVVNKKEHQKGTCGVVKIDNQNSPPKYGSHRRVRPFFLCSKISGFESLNYTPLHASQSFITHYPWMRFQTELSKKHFCITASLLLYPSIEHISLLTD